MTNLLSQTATSWPGFPRSEDENTRRMRQLINGLWITQAIGVVAKLNIADLLAESPRSLAELASATNVNPDALSRVLRVLASIDLFATDSKGNYYLKPLGETLRSDMHGSMRDLAIMMVEMYWGPCARLVDVIRTGQTAFELFYGCRFFEFLGQNPEIGVIFDRAMHALTNLFGPPAIGAYDFSGVRLLADIGGGRGQLLAMVLRAYPEMKGVLYDLPHVVAAAHTFLPAAEVADRVRVLSGDFFEQVPEGADAYMLKNIIHLWQDEKAVKVLRNIRAVISKQGRLLVVEPVISPDDKPSHGKFLDLVMMVSVEGRERTQEEYQSLFEAAGFRLSRIFGQGLSLQILEALPC